MNKLIGALFIGFILFQQTDLDWVDEGSLDFEVPPRGHKFFHKPMTVGYQIILDWETLNEKAVQFWICNPKWTGEMPPARSAIAYSGYSWKMYNYRFKATSEGEWSFIFYNDETVPYTVSLHWVIFKEADAPTVKEAPIASPRTRNVFTPKMLFVGIVGFAIIMVISKFYLAAPKETARERRLRKMHKRRSKRK